MRCEIWAQPAELPRSSVGRALCLEYRVSWVRVPPEAVFFTALGIESIECRGFESFSLPWVCCVALPSLFV